MGDDDELFDLERLRRAWTKGQPTDEAPPVHPVLADVLPQPDPADSALELLENLRAATRLRFPGQRAALDHFLGTLEEHLKTISAASPAAPEKETVTALQEALDSLEDLLEAFVIAERR